MSIAQQAKALKALGDPTRLKIFQFLSACCCSVAIDDEGGVRISDGKTVGQVCCHVTGQDKIPSSISFHLKELSNAGLIVMEKRGKHVLCAVNRGTVEGLVQFFGQVCCCEPQEKTK